MPNFRLGLLVLAPIAFSAAGASAANQLSSSDRTFAHEAAQANMAEIAEAKVAENKATEESVKQFAATMISDHGQANDELKSIASSEGITLPSSPNKMQEREDSRLKSGSSSSFDKDYITHQITDHEKTIALFQKEASNGENPALKSYAQKTLPTLQHHLQMAQSLKKG